MQPPFSIGGGDSRAVVGRGGWAAVIISLASALECVSLR